MTARLSLCRKVRAPQYSTADQSELKLALVHWLLTNGCYSTRGHLYVYNISFMILTLIEAGTAC